MSERDVDRWENEDGVHLTNGGEFTLCGDAWDSPETEDAGDITKFDFKTRRRTITCPRCIEIVLICRGARIKQ